MKRLISLITLLVALSVNAQVIHWITFIDTKDPELKECDSRAREVLYQRFIDVVNYSLRDKGYSSNKYDEYGDNMTPEKCDSIINNLRCDPYDIVVFYYIGHGEHISSSDVFPHLTFGYSSRDKFRSLLSVHNTLKKQNPALLVTIGMCCNIYGSNNSKEEPVFNADSKGAVYCTGTEQQAIQKLFLGHKGDILVASASPGEESRGATSKRYGGEIDMYSAVFMNHFEDGAAEGDLEWHALLDSVSERVQFLRHGEQTPINQYNIRETAILDINQILLDKLNDGFAKLLDRKLLYKEKRDRIIPSLLTLFSPDALIKTVGSDDMTVVDRDTANEFIRRMATNEVPREVTPIPGSIKKSSNNSITELKVKIKKL